jgi:hypothetical protein
MAEGKIGEVQEFVSRWADRTDDVLLMMLRRYEVGITDALYNSVRSRVYQSAGDKLGYDLSFLLRGRFRDMNVGRGRGKNTSAKIETTAGNRAIIQNRRKKKSDRWYSRPFYGRLNALEGALGFALMEQAINSVIKPLQDD